MSSVNYSLNIESIALIDSNKMLGTSKKQISQKALHTLFYYNFVFKTNIF